MTAAPTVRGVREAITRFSALVALLIVAAIPADGQSTQRLVRSTVRADDGESLVVWHKQTSHRQLGAILLLHGRTWSALPNFDLRAATGSVSAMDALAASGYDVYALDQRGYGATQRDSSGWLTPDRAAHDVAEVLDWIDNTMPRVAGAHHQRPALLGYSRGTLTALLTAQRYPDKLSSLILYGLVYDARGKGASHADPAAPPGIHTTAAQAGADFIDPQAASPAVKTAYIRAALLADPIRVDWKDEGEFDVLDPHQLRMPILLLNGERDPYVLRSQAAEFFAQLSGVDRSWTVLANADHLAHIERPVEFVNAVTAFLGLHR